MAETHCVLCRVYHPGAELHPPDRVQTCEGGRRRLEHDRVAVLSMYQRLTEQEAVVADERTDASGRARDPIAAALPMAPTPSLSKKPAVSGSRERQLPINVALLDLTAPAHAETVSGPLRDQLGHRGVATVLYEWVSYWKDVTYPDEAPAPLTADKLLKWIGDRLSRLTDEAEGLDAFAEDLAKLKSDLRHALGESAPKPVVMWGVPCRRCNTISSLVWDPEDPDHYRECSAAGCGLLMSEGEYRSWLVEVVESMRSQPGLAEGASV